MLSLSRLRTRSRYAGAAAGSSLPAWLNGGSIRSDGWSLDAASTPPSTTLEYDLTATRQGYDSAGNATTYANEPLYVTRRVRVPGSTSLDPVRCGLSEYIFQGDVISGLTNNSTVISPQTAVNWAMLDRSVVGDSLYVAVTAVHLFGMPACVRFTATDGTNTVTVNVSTPVAVKSATDQNHLVLFEATLDITSLNNGLVTVNARVFPRIGVAGSIHDSSTAGYNWWEFAPRYYIKDTTRSSAIPRCYVDAAGNDTTGVWSTNDATAAASPFLTIAGALAAGKLSAIPAGANTTALPAGSPDGCEIRLRSGTFAGAFSGVSIAQRCAALIITRDPAIAKANAIVSLAANQRPRLTGSLISGVPGGALRYRDMTLTRSGGFNIIGETTGPVPLAVQLQDVALNGASQSAAFFSSTQQCFLFADGVQATGWSGSMLDVNAGLVRGLTGNANGNSVGGHNTISSDIQNVNTFSVPPALAGVSRNCTFQGNRVWGKTAQGFAFPQGASGNVTIYGRFNNVLECTNGTVGQDYAMHRVSGDGATGSTDGVFIFHETYAGFDIFGRHNDRYVDTDATGARTHVRGNLKACITVQYNTKHDLFLPVNAARIGGWPVSFGCGFDFNYHQFRDAGTFAPDYAGRSTTTGTSNTVGLDPQFVSPAATTSGPTPGAGNGNYRLQSGSPCKSKTLPTVYIPFDADGMARTATTSLGAYV